MNLSRRDVQRALDDRRDLWTFGNSVLYDLCSEYPRHQYNAEVAAKVWLIGRSYAAAVERGVRNVDGMPRDTTQFYRKRVALPIRRSGIDRHIQKLHEIGRIRIDSAPVVLAAHARLTEVLAKSLGDRKRSFVSKYLHFHAPEAVPIYDSLAVASLKRHTARRVAVPQEWGSCDPDYAKFLARYFIFHGEIKRLFGYDLTPRQVDRLLWRIG
jgi:hypothetical protein